ncbi:MAG: DUF2752 domain-containing protein [Eubacterium sp.]|nr:DUF2752 domain-containing protein [Eubacterium sp.]
MCPLRYVFGIPCPGCGMTHALGAFLTGDLSASLSYHPMLLPTAAAAVAALWITIAAGRKEQQGNFPASESGLLSAAAAGRKEQRGNFPASESGLLSAAAAGRNNADGLSEKRGGGKADTGIRTGKDKLLSYRKKILIAWIAAMLICYLIRMILYFPAEPMRFEAGALLPGLLKMIA